MRTNPIRIRKVYPNFFYDKVKIRIFFSTRWDRLINCFEREYFSIQILVIGRFAVIFGRNGLLSQRPTTSKIIVLIDLLQLISTNCEICKKKVLRKDKYINQIIKLKQEKETRNTSLIHKQYRLLMFYYDY